MAKFDAFLFFTKIQISPGISIEASERQVTVHTSTSVRLQYVFQGDKSTIYFLLRKAGKKYIANIVWFAGKHGGSTKLYLTIAFN